jgi:hypothetical protein
MALQPDRPFFCDGGCFLRESNIIHNKLTKITNVINVEVKETEMGMACSTQQEEDEYVLDFDGQTRRKEITRKT